jgi:formylglycine-generating enzyme required for sulfatase activity
MDDYEFVRARQQRLALYRRTIAFLSEQRGLGGVLTDTDIDRQIADVRREILSITRELHAHGVIVDELGADDQHELIPAPPESSTRDRGILSPRYQQLFRERLSLLALSGVSDLADLHLPLADVYIERALQRHDPGAGAREIADQLQSARALADLLCARGARVLLEGERGSGKTTCMRRVALACAMALSAEQHNGADLLDAWTGPPALPIILWAHALDALFDDLEDDDQGARAAAVPRLWNALHAWLRQLDLAALAPIIQRALEQGDCLVLIDGLDDLLEPRSVQRIVGALNEFIAYYPSNRFVAAGRGSDRAAPIALADFDHYRFAPLDRAHIDEMITRWYQALAAVPALALPADVSDRITHLQGLLHGDKLIDELSGSPLLLALWIVAHAEGHLLPAARGIIRMRECDLLLTGLGHGQAKSAPLLQQLAGLDLGDSAPQRVGLLEPLALALVSKRDLDSDTWPALSDAEVAQLLEAAITALGVEPARARQQVIPFLIHWCCCHDLLADLGHGMYTMPRRSLCEYLAARALAALPDFAARARALRRDPRWRDALALAAYQLAHDPPSQRIHDLVRQLLWPSPAGAGADVHDLLLAAECVSALGGLSPREQPFRNELRLRLVMLLAEQRATIQERVRAGTLLGLLGDPRFEDLLPPLAPIAAGAFWLGQPGEYDDEGPAHRVDVPAFSIGIYPVTNQEYAAFLKETGHSPPHYWHDSRFNNPCYPVVGVTWHDTLKYCAWLQKRLDRAGLLPAGLVVRLPLEAEWEKAACWDPRRQAKRRYPWGDDWSDTRANTARGRGDWMTSPVGCYPEGVSPAGLHDCVGNVWEWTASVYANYPGAMLKFHEPGSYTLRGSSCVSLPNHARCTYRSRLPAGYWRYHLGFRIVIARPINGSLPL